MNKYSVISLHEDSGQTTLDFVFAKTSGAAFVLVALARPGVSLVACIEGHLSDGAGIAFAGSGLVTSETLLENADANEDQMAVLRQFIFDSGFEIKSTEAGYYWAARSWVEDGVVFDAEADALNDCVMANDLQLNTKAYQELCDNHAEGVAE